ncbi:hypothetical protein ABS225_20630, partial [Acinetobacter baumannii]
MSLRALLPLTLLLGAAPLAAQTPPKTSAAPADAAAPKVPLDEIRRYVAIYNAIKQAYVEPVEDA